MVWADRVEELIPSATLLEKRLVELIWSDEADLFSRPEPTPTSSESSLKTLVEQRQSATSSLEKEKEAVPSTIDVEDPDKARILATRQERPVALIAPMISGLSFGISMLLMCLGIRESHLSEQ